MWDETYSTFKQAQDRKEWGDKEPESIYSALIGGVLYVAFVVVMVALLGFIQ